MKKIREKNKQKISFPNKRNGKSSVSYGSHSSENFPSSSIQRKTNIFYTLKTLLSQESRTLGTRAAKIRSRFSRYKGENLFGLFFILSLFSLVFLPRNFFPFRHSADCSERKTRDELFDREEYVETMETSCIKFARIRHDHQMSDTLFE